MQTVDYPFFNGYLKEGGFGELGISGFINPHITAVEKISDTEVQWTVSSANGKTYKVTVTATMPTGQKDKRTSFAYTITELTT